MPLRLNRPCTSQHLLGSTRGGRNRSIRVTALPAGLRLRRGIAKDGNVIWDMTLRERMNPLGLDPERFVVVESTDGSQIIGVGQLQPQYRFQELRTLIVQPDSRGHGVGSAIVQELVKAAKDEPVLLTTLKRTIPFYTPHGFSQITGSTLPRALWLEVTAGTMVARIVAGDELVVMGRNWL